MDLQSKWQIFMQDRGDGVTYVDWVLSAWGWTLSIAACAWVLALLVGFLIGTLRTVPSKPLQWFSNAWVELFRNIPLLVQIFLWYQVLPSMFPALQQVPVFALVVLALGLFTSARVAEQVRAGIQSLPRGQFMAGSAIGLTRPQTYRYVILPMASRIVLPPLTSEAMNIIKNSSVAFAAGIAELALYAQQAGVELSMEVEVYLVVSVLYAVSAFGVNRAMAFIEARVRVPGYVGGSK
ncbi:amino acid ABC transporter permease [Caldimonas brevitalea]|uniref:Glutamate ABC transporter permease n=1 Tax=Caldimonas brevitalea TaxID=413882 RepID=A0A0G3BI66_9BURK|nr:amino acid ABC transporter permease [Caldimonas brevitalea]AKJ27688.1 glutamate ABC transporter permease [Caldimonas brevitalea]